MVDVIQPRESATSYLVVALVCAGTTALAVLLRPYLDPANIVMLYLLIVLLAAIRFGRGPAVLAALLGVALFDFFLVPPRLSFAVADVQYLITFAVMLVVALTTAHLAADLRQQARVAEQKERQARLLYELARELAGTLATSQVAAAVTSFLQGIGLNAVLLLPGEDEVLLAVPVPDHTAPRADTALARTAYQQNEVIELPHLAVFGEASVYFPLKAPMCVRGVLAVAAPGNENAGVKENRTLLMTAASLTAIALERLHYVDVAQATQVQMLSERLRSSILSALSHDVRTPLAALVGLADSLALLHPPLPALASETAEAIREQASLLNGLVENLLDMARLNVGEIKLRKEWCLIEDVIGSSLKLLRHALERHTIQVNLAPDLPLVEFDAVLIERVLGNLLENAAKYSPAGSVITISAQCMDEYLVVAVCDNGPGLPPLKREALFDMFVRGNPESATPGTGLGLAICKAIIDAHGGHIEATDQASGGACLRFSLPLGSAPALDDEALVLARGGLS